MRSECNRINCINRLIDQDNMCRNYKALNVTPTIQPNGEPLFSCMNYQPDNIKPYKRPRTYEEIESYYKKDIENEWDKIDEELQPLIKEMNKINGITTISSCIGHGKSPCQIFFAVKDINTLYNFIKNCLYSFTAWNLCVDLTDPGVRLTPVFYLEAKLADYEYNMTIVNNLYNSCKGYNSK